MRTPMGRGEDKVAEFLNAVSAATLLFLLMAVGYGMGRLGWMTPAEKRFLSRFVINVAVPFNCVTGLLNNLDREGLAQAGGMLAAGVTGTALTIGVGMLAATALKLPRERWGVFAAMAGTSNTLFIGLPMTTQLFGDAGIPFLMVYYLCNTTFVQTVALSLIERAGTKTPQKLSVTGLLKNLITKPPIVGLLTGLGLLALGVRPPELVMKFAGYLGGTVTPLALMYCGFIIYEVGLKNLRFLRGIPTMLVIRLILSPMVCMAMCALFGVTGMARGVFIVESALPVVTQVVVMTGAFGADEEYAATGACLSTLGCFITIPVLTLLLG